MQRLLARLCKTKMNAQKTNAQKIYPLTAEYEPQENEMDEAGEARANQQTTEMKSKGLFLLVLAGHQPRFLEISRSDNCYTVI